MEKSVIGGPGLSRPPKPPVIAWAAVRGLSVGVVALLLAIGAAIAHVKLDSPPDYCNVDLESLDPMEKSIFLEERGFSCSNLDALIAAIALTFPVALAISGVLAARCARLPHPKRYALPAALYPVLVVAALHWASAEPSFGESALWVSFQLLPYPLLAVASVWRYQLTESSSEGRP